MSSPKTKAREEEDGKKFKEVEIDVEKAEGKASGGEERQEAGKPKADKGWKIADKGWRIKDYPLLLFAST